jgi:hypothetical protein
VSLLCARYLGGPLDGYTSLADESALQMQEYKSFLTANDGSVKGIEEGLFAHFNMALNDESDVFKYYPTPYRAKAEKNGLRVHWFRYSLYPLSSALTTLYIPIFPT